MPPRFEHGSPHSSTGVVFLGVLVAVVAAILITVSVVSYNTLHTATISVCSKERATTSGGGEYRVYAREGSFVMKDSLIGKMRFSTADAYAKIKPGTTYDIVYKGWRIPFFSAFPNILEANEVPRERQKVPCT